MALMVGQRALVRKGISILVDGDYGRRTAFRRQGHGCDAGHGASSGRLATAGDMRTVPQEIGAF
jgi:hypothetical protein